MDEGGEDDDVERLPEVDFVKEIQHVPAAVQIAHVLLRTCNNVDHEAASRFRSPHVPKRECVNATFPALQFRYLIIRPFTRAFWSSYSRPYLSDRVVIHSIKFPELPDTRRHLKRTHDDG